MCGWITFLALSSHAVGCGTRARARERERGMAGVNQSDHFRGVVGTDNHEQYSLFL